MVLILNQAVNYLNIIYTYIVSISECVFQEIFIGTIIILLYKNGNRTSISNFRPISIIIDILC